MRHRDWRCEFFLQYADVMQGVLNRASLRAMMKSVARRATPSSKSSLREALTLLTPWDSGILLVRVGGDGDGGYLLPDDLSDIASLFSPGVSHKWDFERHVAADYGITSYMIDGSVDAPADLTSMQHFQRLWLGPKSRGDVISLADWVAAERADSDGDLLLQMDIEGSEYQVLAKTPLETLKRFRIVVVEFHGLDWMNISPLLKYRIMPALRKMAVDFEVVHVHPNNCCGVTMAHGIPVPKVLEVTYLRRDRVQLNNVRAHLPHELDRDCVPGLPPVKLPSMWPIS